MECFQEPGSFFIETKWSCFGSKLGIEDFLLLICLQHPANKKSVVGGSIG